MKYRVKCKRTPEGYELSYGRGAKRLTASVVRDGRHWRVYGDVRWGTLAEVKEGWGKDAAERYGQKQPAAQPAPKPAPTPTSEPEQPKPHRACHVKTVFLKRHFTRAELDHVARDLGKHPSSLLHDDIEDWCHATLSVELASLAEEHTPTQEPDHAMA